MSYESRIAEWVRHHRLIKFGEFLESRPNHTLTLLICQCHEQWFNKRRCGESSKTLDCTEKLQCARSSEEPLKSIAKFSSSQFTFITTTAFQRKPATEAQFLHCPAPREWPLNRLLGSPPLKLIRLPHSASFNFFHCTLPSCVIVCIPFRPKQFVLYGRLLALHQFTTCWVGQQ